MHSKAVVFMINLFNLSYYAFVKNQGRWNIKNIGRDKQCCERNLLLDWNRVNVEGESQNLRLG